MRKISAVAIFAAMATMGPGAHAFGDKGDVSFAADRLMGIYLFNEDPTKVTVFGLGASPSLHPYTTARLGIDGFVADRLSIGGSLAYWSYSNRRGGGGSTSELLFAPRVGYAIEISRAFGFWPRGGITYRNAEGNDELALTVEGMFYGAPAEHFAFIFGPAFDLGMVGRNDSRAVNLGLLTAGILGWI